MDRIVSILNITMVGDLRFLLGFFIGMVFGFMGVIVAGHVTSWIKSMKRGRFEEFSLGNDLFDVDIPQILPQDDDT